MLLNNEWVTNVIKEEIKKYLEANENEHTTTQKTKEHCESSSERKVHSITGLLQEARKNSSNLNISHKHQKLIKEQKQNESK